ncbi:MAG: sulfatase [Myxococcota bacterium]
MRNPFAHGASLGLAIWGVEVVALTAGVLGIGGTSVLASLRTELATLGLGYLGLGAVSGVLVRSRLGLGGPVVLWCLLLLVADAGVVPRWMHALLVGLAVGLWLGWTRLPARHTAWVPWTVGALLTGLALLPERAAPLVGVAGDRPDVILVVVDTLRADHVGHAGYGRDTTPVLDALARDGLRFTRARAASSWTLPSHASLFTGLDPAEHGAHAGHPRLDPGPRTLAEAFEDRGYRTLGLSANAWVSGGTGLDRGFDRFEFLGDDGLASQLLLALAIQRPTDLGGRRITDRAIDAMDAAAAANEPLFLFANLLEAHEPLGTLPHAERERFGPVGADDGRRWMRDMPRFWCEGTRADPERIRAVTDAYDAGVAYADARIGELIAAAKRNGRWDRTWLVVTSDHGEHLGEDGQLGHMVWLDDALLDIPLVVHGPGARGTVDTPFPLSGLGAWLLAAVDGQVPPIPERAVSEVHPHPDGTVRAWGAVFGCDFAPAQVPRRAVMTADRTVWRHGDAVRTTQEGSERPATPDEAGWVDGPFAEPGAPVDASTRRALETLGYVE